MYAFIALAAWRVLAELREQAKWAQLVYLTLAMLGLCALLYQGKTGGELVFGRALGLSRAFGDSGD